EAGRVAGAPPPPRRAPAPGPPPPRAPPPRAPPPKPPRPPPPHPPPPKPPPPPPPNPPPPNTPQAPGARHPGGKTTRRALHPPVLHRQDHPAVARPLGGDREGSGSDALEQVDRGDRRLRPGRRGLRCVDVGGRCEREEAAEKPGRN